MFRSVLVANRGEIACRVIRTLRALGVTSIAVHSDADAHARHVAEADRSIRIGGPSPAHSYLDIDAVLAAVVASGAEAVHPGYGFLAENAEFARRVAAAGAVFVGPSPACIAAMGDKINARNLMAAAGVPVSAGTTEPVADLAAATTAAARIGYPVMVKAAGGGGGIGMGVAHDGASLAGVLATTKARATRAFGSGDILLERYLPAARHVEVQILGLGDSTVLALGERDCSVQRRHQKLAEETPAPGLTAETRAALAEASVRAGTAVAYRGAGTVEWLLDPASGSFVFLEMNTRLQVEHTVTELVTGLDLVAEQLRVAAGDPPGFDPAAVGSAGHALQLRVCAEDPVQFRPSPGRIETWQPPGGPGIRVDAGYRAGDDVSPYYDSLLAKLCVWGEDRESALARARAAVAGFRLTGPKHNLPFFAELLRDPRFVAGDYDTNLVAGMRRDGAVG